MKKIAQVHCLRLLTFMICLLSASQATAQSCPNDLYIGYYQENPAANPEDPLPGAIHLSIPKQNGAFSGELFFTYVGCQTRNIGTVNGNRLGNNLNGNWQGVVDGTNQQGSFNGTLSTQGFYSGNYDVAGGKQNIIVEGCADYFIAPFGSWFLFPVLENSADDELIELNDNKISWTPLSNSAATQCQLIDLDQENCNEATASVWQDIRLSSTRSLTIPPSFLVDGQQYAVSCAQFDENGNSLAFSKLIFNYPNSNLDNSANTIPPINFLLLDDDH